MSAPHSAGIRKGLRIVMLGLQVACLSDIAWAQALKDPTRPPAQFLDPADAVEAPPPASGLQTIKRVGKRRTALLHGEWVKPGDRSGEAHVERIDEQAVVLRYRDGRRETIGMYPEVAMKSSRVVKANGGKMGKEP